MTAWDRRPNPPDLKCRECGWRVVWFIVASDGVGGSCYDCGGGHVNYYYETGEVRWL